jgi:hypothetical protein
MTPGAETLAIGSWDASSRQLAVFLLLLTWVELYIVIALVGCENDPDVFCQWNLRKY